MIGFICFTGKAILYRCLTTFVRLQILGLIGMGSYVGLQRFDWAIPLVACPVLVVGNRKPVLISFSRR